MSKNVSDTDGPAAGNAATATIANSAGYIIEGVSVNWSYDATPTGGKLTIKSGTTTIAEVNITAAGPGFLPLEGLETVINETMSAVLAAGGGGVTGKVTLIARYK